MGAGAPCVSAIAINGGVLNFSGTQADNGGITASSVTMTGGTISGTRSDWYHGLTSTPTLITNASSTTAVISSGFFLRLTTAGNLTFNVAPGTTPSGIDLLVSGPITDYSQWEGAGGGVIKTGGGLLCLSGVSDYYGATTISAGTLQLGSGGTMGSISINSAITDNGNLAFNRSGAVTQGTDFSGNPISGSGSLTQMGPGTLILNAHNTYTGTTADQRRRAAIGLGSAIPSGAGTGDVFVNSSGTLDVHGQSTTINALNGNGTVDNLSGSRTGLILGCNNDNGTFSGVIQNTIGGLSLTKTGAGIQTLTGSNTFTGVLTVSQGTLAVT